MRSIHRWKTRLGSAAIAGSMMFSFLPCSVITLAVGEPVAVSWEHREQKDDGMREVSLVASLSASEGSPAAAMIEITLDSGEAAALAYWEGDRYDEPLEEDESKHNDAGETDEGDALDAGGARSGTAAQAALIDKTGGGAVLRVLLTSDAASYTNTLTFSAPNGDVTVDVDEGDIRVRIYDEEPIPDMKETPLLSGDSDSASITTSGFTVYADIPDEIAVHAPDGNVNLDSSGEITYGVELRKTAAGISGKEYAFTITLPDGMSLPSGDWSCENDSIRCGGTEIVKLAFPDGAEGFSVLEEDLFCNDKEISFTIMVPPAEDAVEVDKHPISVTLRAEALVRSGGGLTDAPVTLTVSTADGDETAAATAAVTAAANEPGESGWTVVGLAYEPVTQQIYWADNNNQAEAGGRPSWSQTLGETGEGTITPRLYYTLTQVDEDGNTIAAFAPQELTQDRLSQVGLTAMPTVDCPESTGLLSINAQGTSGGLPTRLEERDSEGNVNRRYTVSWSLVPPEENTIPEHYTLQNIEDPGSMGGSVSNSGWYFVLLDEFTITLDVQQGMERDLTEQEALALLKNFSFYWDYDGRPENTPDHNRLEEMLKDGLTAEYDPDTKQLTVSGLWKYSINNKPISYHLQETNVDGMLSGDELPDTLTGAGAPLDEGDWYHILYDNDGVSNEGQETTAVYSGGMLRLVRGGETQYTANKVWKDAYDQDDTENRPKVQLTLYRYLRSGGISSASEYEEGNVTPQLVWVPANEEADESAGHWEVQVVDSKGELAVLPRYDSQSGGEWIYVVKETLSGGQYEQVFGSVTWDDEQNIWDIELDNLEEWGAQREGNIYLYNGGTLTNLQTGTISVGVTKDWKAATFQSGFDDVVVELTLQRREKGDKDNWETYTGTNGEPMTRYLFGFTAVKLTETLTGLPALEQYQGGDKTRELEYRWIETAVYAGVLDETEEAVKKTIEGYDPEHPNGVTKYVIDYSDTITLENPTGTFSVENERSYTVSYLDGTITNTVQATVDYEAIKEWADGTTPTEVILQIFRTVTGRDFDYTQPYLQFTLNGTEAELITESAPSDARDLAVTWGIDGYENADLTAWPATVSGLPAFDEEGQTYEYILLESAGKYVTPVYRNEKTETAEYRTVVFNGQDGSDGFNLLVRKTWLDNSDTPHRDPVTLTLYNKNTNEPVKDAVGNDYLLILGDDNIWSSVFWIGTADLYPDSIKDAGDDGRFNADDVYLVETSVGENADGDPYKVDHHLEKITYEALYEADSWEEGSDIFDVTTANHRYQVTYSAQYETSEGAAEGKLPGGVGAAFTITNRRLGYIDLTVSKTWVDGRVKTDGQEETNDETLSQAIGEVLKDIYEKKKVKLALAFRLVFSDPTKTEEKDEGQEGGDSWHITYSGPSASQDKVRVGGEELSIYSGYDETTGEYSGPTSSEQVIIGLDEQNEVAIRDEAYFYGLPKYDNTGTAVAYSVEEIWLNVTDADKTTAPVEVTLADMAEDYPELYELWSAYTEPEFEWTYENNVNHMQHTLDKQELKVTNRRGTPKDVTWTKQWRDAYTNENSLRPDLYLDIYRVVHVAVADLSGNQPNAENWTPTYVRKIEYVRSSGDWEKTGNTWKLTLSNVRAFDDYGFEIYYYAVERTQQPAEMYDYQAGEYFLEGTALGTRDEPLGGVEVLSGAIEQAAGDYAYPLLVLGKRAEDPDDTVDSIPWIDATDQPDHIGEFSSGNGYAKYALIEGGIFSNTLAGTYSIDGMKYWTNLPGNWEESRLPGVQFLVYRYTQSDVSGTVSSVINSAMPRSEESNWLNSQIKNPDGTYKKTDSPYYAAQLTISSEQWEHLKSGNGYRYLIQYTGENILKLEDDGTWSCESTGAAVPLARYDENGELYIYEIREVVQWPAGTNVKDEEVFHFSSTVNGFYLTNRYEPVSGSIRVKKFLYLSQNAADQYVYPAVTFRLERWLKNTSDGTYAKDGWYGDVTLTSEQVEAIWTTGSSGAEADSPIIASGRNQESEYVWAVLELDDLPLYAPDGTEYRYSVSEVKTWLNDYDTWGTSGNVDEDDLSTAFGDGTELESVSDGQGDTTTKPIPGLTPKVPAEEAAELDVGDVTFRNQRAEELQTHEAFEATKLWEDGNSGFRPTREAFLELLTLTRTAAEQGGTGGAAGITEELTPWDEDTQTGDYKIQITEDPSDASKWTISIEPVSGTSFEKYAPNGMSWTYSLRERMSGERLELYQAEEGGTLTQQEQQANKIYTPDPVDGVWPGKVTAASASGNFGTLTNSTLTRVVFQKRWQGEDGPLDRDYLGFDLTVEFQLQVREKDSEDAVWEDAGTWTYDGGKTLGLDGRDSNALTGRIAGDTTDEDGTPTAVSWTYTFGDLPGVVQDAEGNYCFLEYRVVETKVSWGEGEHQSQTIELPADGTAQEDAFTYRVGDGLVTEATFSRGTNSSISTNKLDTTSRSVTKVWDDTDNQYGTRPGASGPWAWASWFVLQRSTTPQEETSWEPVAVFDKLYGNHAESRKDTDPNPDGQWTAVITGLPTVNYQTGQTYNYRVRELQPPESGSYTLDTIEEGDIVQPGGTYNQSGVNYTAAYEEPTGESTLWTVKNSLDSPDPEGGVPRNVVVYKDWVGEEPNGAVESVTFRLEYSHTDATGQTVWGPASFLSNGQWEQTAREENDWRVSWDNLPDTDGQGNPVTDYRVVETTGPGWVQVGAPDIAHDKTTGTTTYSYTFPNSIVTSHSVEKVWNPDSAATHAVTIGLYRTTERETVGSAEGQAVPVNELVPEGEKYTVTLDGTAGSEETTAWEAVFTELPKYRADGTEYIYYALELDADDVPIAAHGNITLESDSYEVSYDWGRDKTVVTNTTATTLTATKTWVDNSNVYNTRPDSLTLYLERKAEHDSDWTDVSELYTPDWTKGTDTASDTWTYLYTGLPACDETGAAYTYRVREQVPSGYQLQGEETPGRGDVTADESGAYHFINVLTGTVTISGQKIWSGGVGGAEPALTLERRLYNQTPEGEWSPVSADPSWTKPENSNTWIYTYTGLDKYDDRGVLYEYRVREEAVSGYEAAYKEGTATDTPDNADCPDTPVDGLTITNYRNGALTVSKTVSGNRSDPNQRFTFTVTLTGASLAGTAASDVNKSFTVRQTSADGSILVDEITFHGGISEAFPLKHGESLTILGLPAGIAYEVTEAEADQNGYSTSGTGWTGTIPAGSIAEARFENYSNDSGDDERMHLTGRKIWVDQGENDPKRPDQLTLNLYRKTAGGTEERVYAQPTWVRQGNTWTYTFRNLPETDGNGNRYTYWVSEVVPEGYVSAQNGNNLTNRSSDVSPGSLRISKQVTGAGGDPTQEFTFTVTLSNKNLTGTYGQMVFVNGVATFTLRDGESILAENLPDGITYTVTEAEADQNGYTTTAVGDIGTIAAGVTASADFTNDRPGYAPDTPDEPDIPDEPDDPSTTEDPQRPDEPDAPDETAVPEASDNPEGPEVPTGDKNNMALYGVLTVLFAAGLAGTLYLGRKPSGKKGGKRLRK